MAKRPPPADANTIARPTNEILTMGRRSLTIENLYNLNYEECNSALKGACTISDPSWTIDQTVQPSTELGESDKGKMIYCDRLLLRSSISGVYEPSYR